MITGSEAAFLKRIRIAVSIVPLLALAACIGAGGSSQGPKPASVAAQEPAAPSGTTIGSGKVRIALLLPLSGGQGAGAGNALRNAAELAVSEFQNPDVTILVKDDRGTPEGARDGASQALAEGAELIVGPLFAGSVKAAGAAARSSGKPVIAFSTDTAAAARGIYLLSFLPQNEVERIVGYAASQGKRSVAALIPENAYGGVVEAQFREVAAQKGMRVVAIERYAAGQAPAAIARLASVIGGAVAQADALFLPETADNLPAIGQALQTAGFDPQRVKPLGTGIWNDPRVFRIAALQGGWFAAPDNAGYAAFSARYRAKFGGDPVRIATLSYDAVSLAAALVKTQGSQRFSESVLTNASGFNGADGVFRFKADGTNERGLSVLELRGNGAVTISSAPGALGS